MAARTAQPRADSPSGNLFQDHDQLIVRLDQMSRNEEAQEKLCRAGWDLAVIGRQGITKLRYIAWRQLAHGWWAGSWYNSDAHILLVLMDKETPGRIPCRLCAVILRD